MYVWLYTYILMYYSVYRHFMFFNRKIIIHIQTNTDKQRASRIKGWDVLQTSSQGLRHQDQHTGLHEASWSYFLHLVTFTVHQKLLK